MRSMLSKSTVIYQSEMGPQKQPTTDCLSMNIAPFLEAITHFYNHLLGLSLHGKTLLYIAKAGALHKSQAARLYHEKRIS